jgi:hypothetical protein
MYQREYERRVRTAVVGIGSHSYRNILPALHFLPVELKAVCNRSNRDMAEKTAAEYGCRWYQDTEQMYQNEDLDVSIYFSSTVELAAGEYRVDVYMDGYHIGSGELVLR